RLVEDSLQGVAIIQDEKYAYANSAFAETLGYMPDELHEFSPEDVWNLIHPEDAAELVNRNAELEAGRTPLPRHKFRYLAKDGSIKWVESFVTKTELNGRTALQVLEIDITERIHAEEALRESEEKYRTLVEQSQLGILIVRGTPPNPLFANSEATRIFQLSSEEILSTSSRDLLQMTHPDDRNLVEESNRSFLSEIGAPLEIQFRIVHKDGSVTWLDRRASWIEYKGEPAILVTYLDITEMMTAELALRESEEKYRTLVSSMQDLVFVYNENDEYVQYYASDESLLYVTPDILIGKHVAQVLPDDVAKLHIDAAARVRALEQSEAIDYCLELDGHDHWFSARITLHEDKVSVVSVVRDITPRKEAEFALQESEERFSLFADNFPGPVFIKDEDSVILYANSFMIERFDAADWLGRNTSELFPAEVASAMIETDQRALKEGGLEETQVVPDKEGSEHVYQTFKFPIEREDKPRLIGGISLDVSSRVFTEEALKQSEERYRTLFELAPVSISITDFEGNFTAVNKGFLDSIGYTWDELRFANARSIYANPTGRRALIEYLRREKKIRNVELDLRRKDGTVFTVLLNEDTIELGGKTLILAMIRDVTELKEAEDALKESEEQYRELFHGSRDAVFIHDLEGNILDVNSSVLELLGYSLEEITRMNIGQLHPPYEHAASQSA
ncbi:MAG: PAS domain-containing protein, partial [Candidatus Thorarchaeota archaeon]